MLKWLGLAGLVFALDQATKQYVVSVMDHLDRIQVLPFFAWVRWHNEGAAFSMLADQDGWQHYLFVALAIGFSAFIIYELKRLPKDQLAMGVVYALILGGALGNLVDRLWHGYVIDFILFHYQAHVFPAFNLADSALFCGAALWIVLMFMEHRQQAREKANNVADHQQ